MFCWQARRRLADLIEHGASPGDAVARHIARCAACRADRDAMASIADLVRLASPAIPEGGPGDEEFVHRVSILARRRAAEARPAIRTRPSLIPAAAAISILLLATVLAFFYGGRPDPATGPTLASGLPAPDRSDATRPDFESVDMLRPPREIHFSVRQDLVGVRTGRIPMTTYVLEPPPRESAVVRASF